jgi:hypothetical protein
VTIRLLCLLLVLSALGCAPRQAATTWGYSRWSLRMGAGTLGGFERQQRQCLAEAGVTGDVASVAPNSPEEDAYLECMNGAGWCSEVFHCEKPGA